MHILALAFVFVLIVCISYVVFLIIKCGTCKHGKCNMLGKCTCNKWWSGSKCDNLKCTDNYIANSDKSDCICKPGLTGLDCKASKYCDTKPPCSGHGSCIGTEKGLYCRCDVGFTGEDCSKPFTPTFEGCLTNPPCSGHGRCSDDGKYCICTSEWIGDNCENPAI